MRPVSWRRREDFMKAGLLFDSTACIGCEACAAACKEKNDLPGPVEKKLTAYTWTTVEHRSEIHVRRLCFHCEVPTCASVCPVGAFRKDPQGPVVYDAGRCIGCRYCIMACPFDVPKYQWDRAIPIVQKCTMCADLGRRGKRACLRQRVPHGSHDVRGSGPIGARGALRDSPPSRNATFRGSMAWTKSAARRS